MAIVRAAAEHDLPRILELYQELVITTSQQELKRGSPGDDYQRVFNEIQNVPGYELLVVEENGIVLGTMVLLIIPNLSHSALPWALIENMMVDSSYRRRGLGRLLMDYAIARAKEAGCYKIQLSSNKKRPEAHQFYQSSGFEDSAHGFRMYL
ncbi:MAG: GNAT family N-acetyltransferase [Dehalococcoidales bacterium]|nr:MAG: GNAT family N-acetyltransferase [Dehalococcoidales bacterium]